MKSENMGITVEIGLRPACFFSLVFGFLLFGAITDFAQVPDAIGIIDTAKGTADRGFDILSAAVSPSPTPAPQQKPDSQNNGAGSGSSAHLNDTAYDQLSQEPTPRQHRKGMNDLKPFDPLAANNINVTSFTAGGRLAIEVSPVGAAPYPPVRVDVLSKKGGVVYTRMLDTGAGSVVFSSHITEWVVRVSRSGTIVGYDSHPSQLEDLIPKI